MESQTIQIKEHLLSGKSITQLLALDLCGCLRLSARILEIKKQGLNIKTEMVERGGKRFAEYRLIN